MVVVTEEVGGVKVPIEVNSHGTFSADVGEGIAPITGKTLEEVRVKVRAAVKWLKAKRVLEVTVLGGKFDGFDVSRGDRANAFDAILRGVAERTNRILLTIGGKKIQTDGYGTRVIIARKLTEAEVTQYKALVATANAAEKDLQAFIDGVQLDPAKATEGLTDGERQT